MKQRILKNNTTILVNRGKKSKITDEHIEWLKGWFNKKENCGKPFKLAFEALKNKFSFEENNITTKQAACYMQFR